MAGRWPGHASAAASSIGPTCDSRPLPGDELAFSHEEPGQEETIVFFQEQRSIGGVVVLKGDEPDPVRVVLHRTGTVTGRLVDDQGMPRADVYLNVTRHLSGDVIGSDSFDDRAGWPIPDRTT